MITEKEYLTNYRCMSETEKKTYLQKVDKWSEVTFPNLITLADCWEHVPVKEFDEGLRLASAISNARSFIPVAMRYEAERSLKKLRAYLEEVRQKTPLAKMRTRSQADKTEYRAVVPAHTAPDAAEQSNKDAAQKKPFELPEIEGRRPQHLAQYADRLPKELQKRGESLKDDYLELADYRGRVEVLAEKGEDFKDDVAIYAQKALAVEQKIRKFWYDVDTFLAGGKSEEPATVTQLVDDMRRPGDYTKEEIDVMDNLELAEKCKKARVECDKRYCRRKGIKITDEYREQLAIRINELMEWGENIPEKAYEQCEKAGVVVNGFNDNAAAKEAE